MYNGGVMHPYTSPAPVNPDSLKSVSSSVTSPEDALKLAKMLVQQGTTGSKPKTAEEAKKHAAKILNEYLAKGNWNAPPQRPPPRVQASQALQNRYEAGQRGNSVPVKQGYNKNAWSPRNAKDLEDYITDSVDYYKKHVQPKTYKGPVPPPVQPVVTSPTIPTSPLSALTTEDAIVDRLSIAYVDSCYAESRRGSLAFRGTVHGADEPDAMSALQGMNVAAHNVIRAKMCKPALMMVMSLVHKAAAHAAVCADEGHAHRSTDITEGQNVHFISGSKVAEMTDAEVVQSAVDAWHGESVYYKQVGGGVNGVRYSKNFSQLVWAATTSVGVGVSRSRAGAYVVCCYYPRYNPSDDRTIRANLGM